MRVGIIGCGNISETYFECQNLFNNFSVVACADINIEAAEKSAEKYNVKAFSVDDILSNDEVDLIINLTIPSAHKEIIVKSLNAGKHCFSEKPLAMNFSEGIEIAELAKSKNLYVGCAPDTFLGAAGQKARSLIEENKIGDVVLGTFNLMSHGDMRRSNFDIAIIENMNLMGGFSDEEYDKAKCAGEIEDILNDAIATFMRTDEMKELMLS